MAAMKLPKETDEEKAARAEAMQKATRGAIDVPLRTLRCYVSVVALAEKTCAQRQFQRNHRRGIQPPLLSPGRRRRRRWPTTCASIWEASRTLPSRHSDRCRDGHRFLEEVERRATAVENAVLKALR
jgi:hypothetical protein